MALNTHMNNLSKDHDAFVINLAGTSISQQSSKAVSHYYLQFNFQVAIYRCGLPMTLWDVGLFTAFILPCDLKR